MVYLITFLLLLGLCVTVWGFMNKKVFCIISGIIFMIGTFFFLIAITPNGDAFFLLIGIAICVAAVLVFMIPFFKDWKLTIESKKYQAEHAKKQQELLDVIRSGQFDFSDEFYAKCKENNLTSFNTSFKQQKAKLIVDQIMETKGASEKEASLYYPRMQEMYDAGKHAEEAKDREFEIAAKKAMKEKHLRESTPMDGDLEHLAFINANPNLFYVKREKVEYEVQKACCTLTSAGNKKRKEMANCYYELYSFANRTILDYADSVRSGSSQLPKLEAKRDWAIEGGLASAIGGLGAGIYAAADAAAYNEGVDQRNTAMLWASAIKGLEGEEKAKKIEEKAKEYNPAPYRDIREKAAIKVTFEEPNTRTLFDALQIKAVVKQQGVDYMHDRRIEASITVKNSYQPNIPEVAEVAVDGYLSVRFLCDTDLEIGSIPNYPLPLLGVSCGSSEKMTAILNKTMEGEHKNFRVEIQPVKLWLIEK